MWLGEDRRDHPRTPLERPCKLRPVGGVRFATGLTRDVSPAGALVEVEATRPIHAGDTIELLVAWTAGGLVRREDTISARVVRSEGSSERQRVALSFADEGVARLAA